MKFQEWENSIDKENIEELFDLSEKIDIFALNDPELRDKFIALYSKKLKAERIRVFEKQEGEKEDKPDEELTPEKIPKEESQLDCKQLYLELLAKVKKGEITISNKEQITNSPLSEEKKEELYKILANQNQSNNNQESQPTTNYLPYILGGIGIIFGLIVLSKFLQNKIKSFFKKITKTN